MLKVILYNSNRTSIDFFADARLGGVYRAFMISQVLDRTDAGEDQGATIPRSRAAEIFGRYGLTGEVSLGWTQLYEHIGTVVAAGLTIARRMNLHDDDVEQVRVGALLHDATKRRDVENHGVLASSRANTDHSLADAMRQAGYSVTAIAAAMNTGRDGRVFYSAEERRASIRDRGLVAAIVGMADTRSSGAHFVSLDDAQAGYLARKKDAESREFFTEHWKPYYLAVEDFLKERARNLSLDITDADIYQETIFPEVFGARPSSLIRRHYSFRPAR